MHTPQCGVQQSDAQHATRHVQHHTTCNMSRATSYDMQHTAPLAGLSSLPTALPSLLHRAYVRLDDPVPCKATASVLRTAAARVTPRMLPHLHRDGAQRCHIFRTRTALGPGVLSARCAARPAHADAVAHCALRVAFCSPELRALQACFTFKHHWVWDARARAIVHLSPVPEPVSKHRARAMETDEAALLAREAESDADAEEEPSPVADVAGVSPQSWRRCGRGEPPVPAQM